MKGHIKERSPGKWAIILDLYDASGKRRRKWHSFTGTKRKAQEECSRLITALKSGNYVEPTTQTVAEFLDEWLAFIKPSVAPKTHERYTEILQKGVAPLLGDVTLAKLKTDRIDGAFTKALTAGRRDGKGGLSPRTVHHMRRVLIKALSQAVTWDRLAKNPATATTPPKVERKKMLAYDAAQTAELLDAIRATRMLSRLCSLSCADCAGAKSSRYAGVTSNLVTTCANCPSWRAPSRRRKAFATKSRSRVEPARCRYPQRSLPN